MKAAIVQAARAARDVAEGRFAVPRTAARAAALAALGFVAGCAERKTLAECPSRGPTLALNAPSLAPSVWDDGNRTYLQFPGNTPIPPVFTFDPDRVERPAHYTVQPGGVVVVHKTAPEIRLRDGDKVACIVNHAWSPVGRPTGTGTISPDVVRLPRTTADGA